ncbi:MAG: quaternary ammonium compound efflux SMR transporter SugE [Gammaproteobacteria bacterium]|nr:quaternary ammonium compound efflux SMR transporter SugE [Gammaproteobacteria bacterium]MDE1887334.1 quaternary ammonium compound efflux SMR transporter SugE [Gammaproteobacteria bacterium]MDE2022795.1 quaternary ammonium compound efflux SMR transporter SugE [Gammaproteobacteria bacterium]MDE2140471.1 quaternary ammonium compound efflux SMR transporter SugE [Gammaproteobacteria bacterium]MDE2273598.1 quaternary ammonium compound efflux SMR transporter SugE [Gammaproteobacteria bacterium]
MELSKPVAWALLILAGLFEVAWALSLKYSAGFTRLTPAVLTTVAVIVSMVLLGLAARSLPIGTAYAVWTGIGTVGAVLFGILLFGDSHNALRLVCVALILVGIIGLKLVGE